ncbi:FAD/NAD(P)-binding protein [Candidatus Enterococcus murrayae]|uniref:FAD/NAD(P)-binding protein n=1 Tax=Candidatus Enterococcus murrayae TaxID=2815321 RepID=A0ABS3HMA6_9ENTE|nr:FAD/NAD(P)-binding protein [Enterococcus sp. MJM16]MBO0454112.1 FAD/NAD(P)-binding protein [Enterococcus sp. MJM16]
MKKIAIIGAGPYGLIVLDRLIKQSSLSEKIEILLFDPDGPGGNIWRKDQSNQVIMNTVMQHVTLFSKDEGPNLAEWNQTVAPNYLSSLNHGEFFSEETKLGKNDYCQRRYYGIYQCWFFDELMKNLPANVTVDLIEEQVIDLTVTEKEILIKTTKNFQVDDVILATGHSANYLNETENKQQKYAEEHNLFYQGPGNPSDTRLDQLIEGETVILRGLGLSFFDYIALFVAKWGGKFIEEDNCLVYAPSGKEQLLVVGSGRGLPYHARPNNQKKPGEDAQPQILTETFMEHFRGTADNLFDLLKKEAELVYYQKKLANTEIDLSGFLEEYRKGEREVVLSKYQISDELRLDWTELFDPAKEILPKDFPDFIQSYLKKDIVEAERGNVTGPIASAIDTYKELQEPFNFMLDNEKFTTKEYFEDFFGSFNRNYSFLTIGAPVIRQKQLLALIEAGVIKFLAPEMDIKRVNGEFLAYSKRNSRHSFRAKNLIEARLPATSLKRTKNPLVIQMRKKGYLSSHSLTVDGSEHFTGAIRVARKTHQVIDQTGVVLQHIYCYGIPLEGLDWLNAASPRPKSNDRVFYLANQIVNTIYR